MDPGSFDRGFKRFFHIRAVTVIFGYRASGNKEQIVSLGDTGLSLSVGLSHKASCAVALDAVSDLFACQKRLTGIGKTVFLAEYYDVPAARGLASIESIEIFFFSEYIVSEHTAKL